MYLHAPSLICLGYTIIAKPTLALTDNKLMTSPIIASTEIRTCFDKWTNAWNEGNIEGYLDGYADSPSVRYVSGKKVTKGKDNIVSLFQERGARGVLKLVHFESECVSASDAVCFGQYRLVECTGGDDGHDDIKETHEGCFTVHVRKINGSWKIISDHSS